MSLGLDGADVVVLATAHARGGAVHDDLTGTIHPVNERGDAVLRRLDGRHRWRDVLAAEPDATPFVEALGQAGLVRVRRSWRTRLHPAAAPAWPPPTLRRWSAGPCGIAAAVLVAARPVLAVGAAVAVPLLVVAPSAAALVPALLVLAGVLTTVVHELGHVWVLHATGVDVGFVSATRGRVAVAHGPGAGRAVALAGPLAGAMAAAGPVVPLAWALPAYRGLVAVTAALLAAGHLLALAPGFADGRRLWGRVR